MSLSLRLYHGMTIAVNRSTERKNVLICFTPNSVILSIVIVGVGEIE